MMMPALLPLAVPADLMSSTLNSDMMPNYTSNAMVDPAPFDPWPKPGSVSVLHHPILQNNMWPAMCGMPTAAGGLSWTGAKGVWAGSMAAVPAAGAELPQTVVEKCGVEAAHNTKKEAKRKMNRESAARCRAKKQKEWEALSVSTQLLQEENARLKEMLQRADTGGTSLLQPINMQQQMPHLDVDASTLTAPVYDLNGAYVDLTSMTIPLPPPAAFRLPTSAPLWSSEPPSLLQPSTSPSAAVVGAEAGSVGELCDGQDGEGEEGANGAGGGHTTESTGHGSDSCWMVLAPVRSADGRLLSYIKVKVHRGCLDKPLGLSPLSTCAPAMRLFEPHDVL